jgi:AAA15 family ATPase/GTPase
VIFSLILIEKQQQVMLIRFSVENFLSFKERQVFSMIPGKGTLKSTHKTKSVKGVSVLKSAVVFGANASGKSNLIKAISFGQRLVLRGTKTDQNIKFQNFRLDTQSIESNSRIEYEIQHKGKNYAYGFIFNTKSIVEEWLFEVTKTSDIKIFERNTINKEIYDLELLLSKNKKEDQKQFLKFVAKGTPENQLFLTEIRTRKMKDNVSDIKDLLNVIDWFQNTLTVIFPDDKYNEGIKSEILDDKVLQSSFKELLDYFDTGINGISLEKIELEKIEIPSDILSSIKEDMFSQKSESIRAAILSQGNTSYFLSKKDGDIFAQKFMTKHKVKGSDEDTLFDTSDESDGTNRIIDFIPLLIDLLQGNNVFIIDEMERSLHPNLIYELIDLFLDKSKDINSQLILASHESSLLTQKLLRKDEIWFTVKNTGGASALHSLEQYNVRFDKEIRKDYLLGRFKAVPKLGNRNKLTVLPNQNS